MSESPDSVRKYSHIICEGEMGYRRCTRCIMDTTDPAISFDANGVCNHCLRVDQWKLQWNPEGDQNALEQMIETIKKDGKGKDYDMIMGLSGGVDSSYVAKLAKDFGLRTLVVHCDTGWNSELAVKNIENIVSKCGFDLVTHVVDWESMRNLQLAFFKSGVPNQDIPQDHAIAAVLYSRAFNHGIKWLFSGSNFAYESILPTAWGYDAMDMKHLHAINKAFGNNDLSKYPKLTYTQHGWYRLVLGMKIAKPLNMVAYSKSNAMQILQSKFGWKYYGGKHYESQFTKFFQGWYLPTKWGFDKRIAHFSSLIINGEESREGALHLLNDAPFSSIEVDHDKAYIARKLNITLSEMDSLVRLPNIPHEAYAQTSQKLKQIMKSIAGSVRSR